MNILEFASEKRKAHLKLVRTLVAGGPDCELQPKLEELYDGETDTTSMVPVAVYLTSVRHPERNVTAGKVSVVAIGSLQSDALAAQRIVEGTHRISTTDEIKAWMREQIVQKHSHAVSDARVFNKSRGVTDEELNKLPAHLVPGMEVKAAKKAAAEK